MKDSLLFHKMPSTSTSSPKSIASRCGGVVVEDVLLMNAQVKYYFVVIFVREVVASLENCRFYNCSETLYWRGCRTVRETCPKLLILMIARH